MPSHDRLAHLPPGVSRRQMLLGLAAVATTPALSSSFARPDLAQDQITLTLVAYSTPREAYEEIIPLFQATPEGANVVFETSFAASGEQSRAVESGLPADIIALSLEPDITRLIEPGLVAEDWNADEYNGMVTDSVVVLAVRPGNPKEIATWDDLLKEGVEVITPNPLTSGGARWNVMAAYGAQLERGKSPKEAEDYLAKLFEHVPVLDKSARESLQTFTSGKGDVLLGYENEAVLAQQNGEQVDYVVPDETILIENPIATLRESKNREKAQAFVEFLYTEPAQRIFARKGYRPVVEGVVDESRFKAPSKLFEIDRFGGWPKVNDQFFDPQKGTIAEIFRAQGKSTASG